MHIGLSNKGSDILGPIEFLKTIYLGERLCTKLVLDNMNNQIEIHLNLISRIRDSSGEWNYYSDEDVEDGIIVLTGVTEIHLDPSGLLPNDQIYDIYVKQDDEQGFEFTIEASHVTKDAVTHDLTIVIKGEGIHIIDPKNPHVKIVD